MPFSIRGPCLRFCVVSNLPDTVGTLLLEPTMEAIDLGTTSEDSATRRDVSHPSGSKPQKHFTRLHRIVLIGAPIVSFGTLGFLAFLWAGSYRARNSLPIPQSWYKLLDRDWVLRAVTLTTLALRTATALDAGIATSMLAALLLERQGVRLSQLAGVSVLRSTDSPPHTLAWIARNDILGPPLHKLRYLLTILLLTTLATQLASTILLFDFNNTTIPRSPAATNSTIRYSYSATSGPIKFYNSNQAPFFGYSARFPRFAEYSEPPAQPAPAEERTFQDTGIVYRAFIPLQKESREKLKQYSGPATVLSAQVVCVRPNISRFAVSSPQIPRHSQILFANLTYSLGIPALPKSIDIFAGNFSKSAAVSRKLSVPVSISSMLLDDNPGLDANQWPMSVASVVMYRSRGFLLLNWTGSFRDWNSGDLAFQDSWQRRSRKEWTTLSHRTRSVSVDVTMCVTRFNSSLYLVDTDIGVPAIEPEVAWDNATGSLTTADAATYLGQRDRPNELLFHMTTPPAVQISGNNTGRETIGIGASVTEQVVLAMENMVGKFAALDHSGKLLAGMRWAATLCYDINLDSHIGLHNSFTGVFQDVMQRTRNPAVAVQSLLTMGTANAYVELQPYFDFVLPVAYSVWAPAFIPTRWRGFGIIAAAVVVHALAVAIVVVLFVRETSSTQLGNSWQAVSQVMDDETRLLIPEAAKYESGEFQKRIKSEGRNVRYRIVKEGDSESPKLAKT
ncbi:hypothetical protein B0T25DRAFT_541442 [Lasiosphaeria hispida]|uniref:Uncharacterized protein n=1 Tax=Lasiosphaeria hispida TaxID=260671 RepID=A0AAJ0MD98_9PEZI|nr:hypothetical protein B0T25DRAFT_541442 [Lasiosphaeria hispida]